MLTFKQAKELFSKARDKSVGYRLPGREGRTRLRTPNVHNPVMYSIRYCNTDVVNILCNGMYELYTDGYHTKTTKERIETYSPVFIISFAGQWFFTPKASQRSTNRVFYKFYEGVVISNKGKPVAIDYRGQPWTHKEIQETIVRPHNRIQARKRRELAQLAELTKPFDHNELVKDAVEFVTNGKH